jgi:uncharacterized protein (TIGR02466 family)
MTKIESRPTMPTHTLFPTLIHAASLRQSGWRTLNESLLRECLQLRRDDGAGRTWSKRNYPGGYTSYDSANRMHEMSPTFAALEERLRREAMKLARTLDLDLSGRALAMTDCWVNIMPRHVVHGLHLHPLATISGTYYVRVPKGSPGLKFEDPRLDRFMASPPRGRSERSRQRPWVILPAQDGTALLFESWLRHEVAPNPVGAERISISFNYGWF